MRNLRFGSTVTGGQWHIRAEFYLRTAERQNREITDHYSFCEETQAAEGSLWSASSEEKRHYRSAFVCSERNLSSALGKTDLRNEKALLRVKLSSNRHCEQLPG